MADNVSCLFVVPHFSEVEHSRVDFLKQAVVGLLEQTDPDWKALIIDDASQDSYSADYLSSIEEKHSDALKVVRLSRNSGPGFCRNIGIEYAKIIGTKIVMFNDDDDISLPNRVEVTKLIFSEHPNIGVLYSSFNVIDENSSIFEKESIPYPILEVLNTHNDSPVEGLMAWKKMGLETGYTNTTSSTSVLLKYMEKCYFPNECASEDFHTWMRLSSIGASYKYTNEIPCYYRIPKNSEQQASRMRMGNRKFNELKIKMDTDGFIRSMEHAILRGEIFSKDTNPLLARFYKRLALSMKN
jgi:glycosyltransferase involved in cell wall biosynthesis